MSYLGFLFRKKFYIHLGISVIITIVLVLLVFQFLKSYTRHNESFILENFKGKTLEEISLEEVNDIVEFVITDSIYVPDETPGAVIKQNPSAGSKVKRGRKVYVTIVATIPEMTFMPDLKDLTLRQAVTSLKSNGLRVGMLEFRPQYDENAVLGQFYKNDTVVAGTELEKGSVIDLVVGAGLNRRTNVPFLIGLTLEQAIDKIHMASFNVGSSHFLDEAGTEDFRVYRQNPDWEEQILRGEKIDLWFRSDLLFNFDSLVFRLNPDSTVIDTSLMDIPEDMIFEE